MSMSPRELTGQLLRDPECIGLIEPDIAAGVPRVEALPGHIANIRPDHDGLADAVHCADREHLVGIGLQDLVPRDAPGYRHAEGNSDSHVKASMMGSSCRVLIDEGRLVLGTWQGIYLCEFDGPRTRSVHVQVSGS